ncbi:hypothetical protein BSZ21_21945 [Bradyrhizobium canariense]|uniref:hypothetical protein n=1 Tax=Bradyrhizobium canariense TaxID=255045 RepID=UPI000A197AFC|nr:hypothetical protein [Bradyrhizobium canariense]OSI65046.1 hypothetical protein BSZ21_21945 [Bradyrhizobium canariense]
MAGVLQRDDWRADLASILPDFFTRPGRDPCVPECGPGWAAVVDRCCVRIAAALEPRESFRFESIEQSQGALRIRWGGRLSAASEAAVRTAIDLAEARSLCVCELCGLRGKLFRAEGVLATRCPGHAEGVPARSPGMEQVHLIRVTVKGRLRVVVGARYDFGTDAFVEIDDVRTLGREA